LFDDPPVTKECPVMRESAAGSVSFADVGPLPLEVDFRGGRLTSDGGLAWIAEVDAALGVTTALAAVIPDWRKRSGRHDLATLLAQRVYQIACGYEDQNDADHLRTDPLLKHVCGRLPETDRDLASQPTFSRLENAISARTCYRLAVALGEVYLRERERDGVPTHLVLDLDGTDDPTYGEQEGTAYHGYFRQHQYFPLVVFDGDTNQLITAILRRGTVHASHGVVALLKRIVRTVRARWPGVTLELRADSGFAIPALYDYCEADGIAYTIGLVPNSRLEAAVTELRAEAHRQSIAQHGAKVRLVEETAYQAAPGADESGDPAQGLQHPLRRHHPDRSARGALRLVRGPRRERELDQGPQGGLLCRPAQLPPLLGESISPAPACRRLLAAGYASALAAAPRRGPDDAGDPSAAADQDRGVGAGTARSRAGAPGHESSE
jgi:hypothetical protein